MHRWRMILLGSILSIATVELNAQTASDIIKRSEEQMRGNSLQGTMSVKIIRPAWSRDMTVKVWMKGEQYAMILIQSPVKDKGITFFRREKEVWNWMPAIERVIKLPPSMMSQSWMGTDFSNDYLVRESSLNEDYEKKIGKDSLVDGKICWKLILTPKPEAAVVWSKVVLFIDKANYLQLLSQYYDEEDQLINFIHAYKIERMGGRMIPTVMEMVPAGKPGNKTILTYQSLVFDQPAGEDFFTTQNMKQLQ